MLQVEASFGNRFTASNYWLTTPKLMLQYIEFMSTMLKIINTDSQVAGLLDHDAHYSVRKESRKRVARTIFGRGYYELHPFVLERMPSFFFSSLGVGAYFLFVRSKLLHYNVSRSIPSMSLIECCI